MDTEKFLFNNQNIDISFHELSELELEIAESYIEITRHLQEIHNLYLIFMYSINTMRCNYEFLPSGEVLNNRMPAVTENDYIAVNAMVNNVISAGSTLVEALECCIDEHLVKGDSNRENYMKQYHDTYDNSFSYRFLIRLRDYSQHGHLPVNKDGEWYGFNLYHILNKPHFNHNARIKQQMENATREIMDTYGNEPKFSLTVTIAEYVAMLLSIYCCFWNAIEETLAISYEKIGEVISNNIQNINTIKEKDISYFVYDVIDGNAQIFFISDDPIIMFRAFKNEAEKSKNSYTEEWNKIKKSLLTIRVVDKKYIEIGGFNG